MVQLAWYKTRTSSLVAAIVIAVVAVVVVVVVGIALIRVAEVVILPAFELLARGWARVHAGRPNLRGRHAPPGA